MIPARTLAIAAAVAAMIALPFVAGAYTVTLMSYIGMSSVAALGLVMLTGVGGLTSFGQAAFVGLGAYATAVLTLNYGLSAWVGLAVAVALTSLVALALGAATLRLGGHLLPLSTIAWGLALYYLFGNLDALGRHNGISAIPPVSAFGWEWRSGLAGYYLIWMVVGISLVLCGNLLDSRWGRAIRSLRGGTAMAESLGIDSFRARLAVFTLAGALAGLAGWLLAHVQRFIAPSAFDVGPGIEYLFMALLGGAGHIMGAVLGAALVTLARDALQDILPHFVHNSGQVEVIAFGALFILLLQNARGGLIPAMQRLLPVRATAPPLDAPPLPRRVMPPRGTRLLSVRGVTRRFGGLVAVGDVSFDLQAGEILGLIGPNGAGKSTMFNLITGALAPSAGSIELLEQDITRVGARRVAGLGVARSFQHLRLRPTMTVLENVMLGTHLRTQAGMLAGALRLDRAEDRQAQAEAMRQLVRVGLAARPHELAGNLALGQQRILEVARALASDPVLLVLDEPAAGLRRAEKVALAALLRQVREAGVTILLVEHDMEFVMELVDRLVVMDFGVRLAEGTPAVIRANAAVQEAYLGGVV